MASKDDDFLAQLRATFKVEAGEHLQAITAGLLELESGPLSDVRRRTVETVFRAAHSLKGAARAVNMPKVETLCQSLEDVFASWKRQKNTPSPGELDKLHQTLDAIGAALEPPGSLRGTEAAHDKHQLPLPHGQTDGASQFSIGSTPSPAHPEVGPDRVSAPPVPNPAGRSSSDETVRIAVAKLDAQVLAAEEMLVAKLIASERAAELQELSERIQALRNTWAAVEPEASALRQAVGRPRENADRSSMQQLSRLLDFFEWNLSYLRPLEDKAAALGRAAEQDRHLIARLVDELLEDSKKLLLLPFSTITGSFPKMVRNLCRDQGKEAEIIIRGGEVEVDKRVLEEMKDPLIHLLRNSVDHGIETPDRRAQQGKSPRGTISLSVSQVNGNKVELLFSDDGAGIDAEKVKTVAIKHGLITDADARQLSDFEAQALAFHSEVSTSPIITQVSGRGLGLAIVREKAEKLGGTISLESLPGAGTRIRLLLPSTLATFHGVLVESAGRLFIVPTGYIERVARVKRDEIQTVEGREAITLGGRAIALMRLSEVLELPPTKQQDVADVHLIILGTGDQRMAFAVDEVMDDREILVKPLRRPLARVRNVAGATVLASGQVVPIINVADLMKSAKTSAGTLIRAATGADADTGKSKSILVVEDSITSRALLKGILESVGYTVNTAVDGMEAFTMLRAENFDLVVSDVEMPRLDGFDLTERIRSDKKLAELPVILVTALETREDRERGIDVGANAYIVKSSFDQSNLLEAIRRLI